MKLRFAYPLGLALCLIACADGESPGSMSAGGAADSGIDNDAGIAAPVPPDQQPFTTADFVAPATAPRLSGFTAAPPNQGACPAGWASIPLEDGNRCDPPPTRTDCSPGEWSNLAGACQAFGADCPSDGWAADLPTEGPIVYVDSDAAPGGNGQRETPFNLLSDALSQASDGAIVALRSGDHAGPIQLTRDVTLWGACAAATRLVSSAADEPSSLHAIANVTVRGLTVTGPRPAIEVGIDGEDTPQAQLTLDTVAIVDVVRSALAVWPQAQLTADNVWVNGVSPLPDTGRSGLLVIAERGNLVLRQAVLEGGSRVGLLAIDSADVSFEDVAIRRIALDADDFGLGVVAATNAQVSLVRTVIEDVYEYGVQVDGATVDGQQLAVRDVAIADETRAVGYGLYVDEAGQLTVRGGTIRRVGPVAVIAFDPDTRLGLYDLWIGEMNRELLAYTVVAVTGSALTADRVWIDDESGINLRNLTTSGLISNLNVRGPPGPYSRVPVGALSAAQGVQSVIASAIDVRNTTGVTVFSAGTSMEVRGLRVRQNGNSSFSAYSSGGTLRISDAELEDADFLSLSANPGATLIGEDIVVRGAGFAISGLRPQLMQLTRVRVEEPTGTGVWISGGQTELEDVFVNELSDEDELGGYGVYFTGGATASLSRLQIDNQRGFGLAAYDGARLSGEDIRIDTSTAHPGLDFGVFVDQAAAADLSRLSINGFSGGIAVEGRAVLNDVYIKGRSTVVLGFGIGGRGAIELRRARLEDTSGIAAFSFGTGPLVVEDLVINNVEPNADDVSIGLAGSTDAVITANRVRITQTRTAGLYATTNAQIVARDVTVSDSKRPSCVDVTCGIAAIASGAYVQEGGAIDLERFELLRLETAGFFVSRDGSIDAREGVIGECGFGLLVEGDVEYDPARISDRVWFRNNTRDILERPATFPPIQIEPLQPPDPISPSSE